MAPDDLKDSYYDELRVTICKNPTHQCTYILGNLNARVGSDHTAWPCQPRHHGVRSVNENGQRVSELCTEFDLCVTNAYICGNKTKRVS